MKVFANILLIVTGAAIGLAVGFALRGTTAFKMAETPLATSSAPTTLAKPIRLRNGTIALRGQDDSPLATKLEQDLSLSSGVTRWLYWLEALEKAAPADFPRLIRLAQGSPAAMRLVEARWVETAPRHLFDTIVAGPKEWRGRTVAELAEALFREWPRRDPDAAIAALNETNDLVSLQNWRFDVAYNLIGKDIERGLRLLSEWHVNDTGFGSSGLAAIAKWTRADPRHAAEFILDQPAGYSIRSTIETIGKEWSATDPAGALAFAASKPGELSSMLANSVLKDWAGRNLGQAADWLSVADDRTRSRLSPTFVEAWGKVDAGSALEWCEANLTGSTLAHSVAGLVSGASETDVAQAATLVAGMNPSQARAEAAVKVAQKWFPKLASDQPATPETVAWLASLDSDSVRRVLDKVSWGWATSDPKSMAAFLVSSSTEQVPSYSYTTTARELARRNPQEALEWASHLPEKPGLTAGGDAFAEWRSSQPEAAMKWLNDLPPDDARRQPFFQSAIRALAYHPQAAEQLQAMNPAERALAQNVIETMTLPEDRRARLLAVLKPQ